MGPSRAICAFEVSAHHPSAAHVVSVKPRTSPASPRLGAITKAVEPVLADDPAVAMELADLGLDGVRADRFREGREEGESAARHHGYVPDHVVDAIAVLVTADHALKVAG